VQPGACRAPSHTQGPLGAIGTEVQGKVQEKNRDSRHRSVSSNPIVHQLQHAVTMHALQAASSMKVPSPPTPTREHPPPKRLECKSLAPPQKAPRSNEYPPTVTAGRNSACGPPTCEADADGVTHTHTPPQARACTPLASPLPPILPLGPFPQHPQQHTHL
jgi:hypothetical protein